MPIGGKLVLKGGATLGGGGGVEKKKKKKKTGAAAAATNGDDAAATAAAAGGSGAAAAAPSAAGPSSSAPEQLPKDKLPQAYEQSFALEAKRLAKGDRERSTAWGATYRKPPAVLHGYSAPIRGDTAEERLDLRAASKADRYCK